jgi:ATPase subunit of ABC transporter with duplicated ATPase domains
MPALLTIDRLSAATPDGKPLFQDLSFALGDETVGLVGRNGSGKSTLLAILSGALEPLSGTVSRSGRVAVLRQVQPDDGSVAGALGVTSDLSRLHRLEAGEGTPDDAGLADWTLEQRIAAAFERVRIAGIGLDRTVASLSGGERTRLALAAMLLAEPDVLLMDEPTNNLDVDGRVAIAELLAGWPGGAIIASHDRVLLESVDRIVQLSPVGVTSFGGGWSAFEEARDALRERAEADLDRAERDLRQQSASAQRQHEKKARRDKAGRAKGAKGDMPRILIGAQIERAQNSGARDSVLAERMMDDARGAVDQARRQVEIVTPLRIELPRANVPANRTLLCLEDVTFEQGGRKLFGPLSFTVTGPERVLVSGPNGSGKTTLLHLAMGLGEPTSGKVTRTEALAMLDQHVALLDPALDLVANLRRRHPGMTAGQAHKVLARFAFRNRDALRPAATLSGGEKLRAGLAIVTAGQHPPQMLLLDEPTNHLDIEALEMLESALANYDGALLLVSHDRRFIDAVGFDLEISLGAA